MTEFGIQMYSLRDITKSDMNRALGEIARMGYKTAEFAGFFGYKSEYIKGLLDKYGIKAVATHTGYGDLVNNFAATVAYHKAIGCYDIIIPGAPSSTKEDVALYIHLDGELPLNFMTKKQARDLGWEGGSVERYKNGAAIGGDKFGNYEGLLPKKSGRKYYECDIDTNGKNSRGAKRIIFSNDGLIYYTDDHYESFTLLYERK